MALIHNERITVKELQNYFAKSLGYKEEIVWDLVPEDQPYLLKRKIEKLSSVQKIRDSMFSAVWNQRKYTNGQSLTAIICVVVVPEEEHFDAAEESTNFSCHPVIIARRCMSGKGSSNCCNLFVDENARVYQNWKHYVDTNVLPPGTMVVPKSGIYQLVGGELRLDKFQTPAGSAGSKTLQVLDKSFAIGGLACAGVSIVAVCGFPFTAVVMGIFGFVSLAIAAYATTRSIMALVDRSTHEQLINLTDQEARRHWLTAICGIVGIAAAGITKAFSQWTDKGRTITSMALSGTRVANGIVDIVIDAMDGEMQKTSFNLNDYGDAIFKYVANAESFPEKVRVFSKTATPKLFNFILKLTGTFLNEMLNELPESVKFFISTEFVLTRLLMIVLTDYREKSYEFIKAHHFQILQKVKRQFLLLNSSDKMISCEKCKVCKGIFTVCTL
ncbi:uncharacterized protein [Drosophila bipectinata]|uniref:uncharacterized protein n=1 Tax=Drosophila bipectinata TaxID=42026 RepID=UPI001C89AE9A|nr:uncharacterized protein LOC108129979 [Drosophila bipectinata]